MSKTRNQLILGGLLVIVGVAVAGSLSAEPTKTADPQLAHMVYFKLKDSSGTNRAKLVAACKLYLSGHPGTVYFGVGTHAADLNGEVNDHEFDVSLNVVFASKEAHDNYQEHARHKKFIAENIESLEKVRVFDSYLSPTSRSPEASEK